jgi:O-antigen/teichoic acid export membrane protein
MLLFVQMFRFAWQPFFLQIQDEPGANKVFARAFTLFSAIGALVVLGVSFYAHPLAMLVFGKHYPEYSPGLFIVPIILMAYLAQGWYTHFTAGVFIRSRTRDLPWITLIGAVITLAANLTLTPRYGMAAAAWATLLSYLVMAAALGRVSQGVYPVPYEWLKLAAGVVIAGAAFLAAQMAPENSYVLRAALLGIVIALFYAVGLLPRITARTNRG